MSKFIKKPTQKEARDEQMSKQKRKRWEVEDSDNDEDFQKKLELPKKGAWLPDKGKVRQDINMIHPDYGPMGGCCKESTLSNNQKKMEMRALMNARQICMASTSAEKAPSHQIVFFEDNLDGIVGPNNDSLVNSAHLLGMRVHWLLVDTGAYVNILFKKTLN